MQGWMKHKQESKFLREISITSSMHATPPLWQKVNRNWIASWGQWKRRVKKLLKTQHSKKAKIMASHPISSVQFSRSVMSDSLQPHESQHTRPPCPPPTPRVYLNPWQLSQWCHLILCHPLLLLPPILPSIRVFSNESALHMRWPKYWSFSFSISPSNEQPGLISFRMD